MIFIFLYLFFDLKKIGSDFLILPYRSHLQPQANLQFGCVIDSK